MRAPVAPPKGEQQVQQSIRVPREAVGFVIGRHGETVRNMSYRSGAQIAVDETHKDPGAPYGIFNINGSPTQVRAAMQIIAEKVEAVLHGKSTYHHAAVRDSAGMTPTSPTADSSGQSSSTRGSPSTRSPRSLSRIANNGTGNTAPSSHDMGGAGDPRQDSLRRTTNGENQPETARRESDEGDVGDSSDSAHAAPISEQASPLSIFPALEKMPPPFEMWIPKQKVGMIIGHCGQVINGMQERSGATIVVHNDRMAEDGSKMLTISGGEKHRQIAKSLIQGILNREPRPPRAPAYENRRIWQSEPPHTAHAPASSPLHPRPVASTQPSVAQLGGISAAHRAARERPPDQFQHRPSATAPDPAPDPATTTVSDPSPAPAPVPAPVPAPAPASAPVPAHAPVPVPASTPASTPAAAPASAAGSALARNTADHRADVPSFTGPLPRTEQPQGPSGQPSSQQLEQSNAPYNITAQSSPPDRQSPLHEYLGHRARNPVQRMLPPSHPGTAASHAAQQHFFPHGHLGHRVPFNAMHFVQTQHGRAQLIPPTAMITKQVKVPTSCVGIVIGKGGETIRDLQSRSGAYIKVTPDREANAQDSERVIYISGTFQDIELAHNLLNDIVNEGLGRNYRDGVEPGRVQGDEQAPSSSHLSTGLHHSSQENMQHPHLGIDASRERQPHDQEAPAVDYEGSTEQGRAGEAPEQEASVSPTAGSSGVGSGRQPGVSGEGDTNTGRQAAVDNEHLPQFDGDVTIVPQPLTGYPSNSISILMHVPNVKVGVIIGKRGQTIRELQQRSGARIVISKKMDTSKQDNPRSVKITGPPLFAQRARALIIEKIRGGSASPSLESSPGNPRAVPAPGEMPQQTFRLPPGQYGHQHMNHPMPGGIPGALHGAMPGAMPAGQVPHAPVPVPSAAAYPGFQGQVPYMPVDQRFESQQYQNPNVAEMHVMRTRFAQQAFQTQQQQMQAMQQQVFHQQALHQQALQQQQTQAHLQGHVPMTIPGYAPQFQVHPAQFQAQPQVTPFPRNPQQGSEMSGAPNTGFRRGSMGSGEEMEEYQSEIQAGVHMQQGQNVIPGRAYHDPTAQGEDINELITQTGSIQLSGPVVFQGGFAPQYQYHEAQKLRSSVSGPGGVQRPEDNRQKREVEQNDGASAQAEEKVGQQSVDIVRSNGEVPRDGQKATSGSESPARVEEHKGVQTEGPDRSESGENKERNEVN